MSGAAGSTQLKVGMVRLTDSAPLVMAKELGYFAEEGLQVRLSVEPSWSTIRDKVSVGELDAAQMLAGIPLAATLGLAGVRTPMIAPLSLGLSGNGITVSRALELELRALTQTGAQERLPRDAKALKRVIAERQLKGLPKLAFGVVYPFASHNYQLRYWMASAGIDPDRDVEVVVVPPAHMVGHLEAGRIDGYCVGEPWNALAVDRGLGCTLLTSAELWNNCPDKVLGVTAEWAERHPEDLVRLIRALVRACAWLDDPQHRARAAQVLAGEPYLGIDAELLQAPLEGQPRLAPGQAPTKIDRFNVFHAFTANYPWRSHALWFLTQMLRWGQIAKPLRLRDLAEEVYRPDLYRAAIADLGLPCPVIDEKSEGLHEQPWTLGGNGGEAIAMGADAFFDGGTFDPRQPIRYLSNFAIRRERVALEALGENDLSSPQS